MAHRKMLGLAIGEKAISVAQSDRPAAARFEFPAELDWSQPQKLGAALRAFLQRQGFTARRAVAGVAGRRLFVRPQTLPPVDDATRAGALRLAVERQFPLEGRELNFDYAPAKPVAPDQPLLLVAASRAWVNTIAATLAAAGLETLAVTATALSLAQAEAKTGAMLYLCGDGAELLLIREGQVVAMQRLDGELVSAARRAMAQWPTVPPQLVVVDDAGASMDALKALGMPVEASALTPAQALARTETPDIDFLASKLAPPTPRRFTRAAVLGAAAVLAVILGLGSLGLDLYLGKRNVAGMRVQLDAMKEDLAAAKVNVARAERAHGSFDARPPMLDGLEAMTKSFPETAQVWATSFALRADLSGTMAGKATGDRAVIELLDRLKKSPNFRDVNLLYLRQALGSPAPGSGGTSGGGTSGGVTFSIGFRFTPGSPGSPGSLGSPGSPGSRGTPGPAGTRGTPGTSEGTI